MLFYHLPFFRIISEWPTRSRLSPLLNKGTRKNPFQMAGKTPANSDKLKTNVKGALTTETNRFKKLVLFRLSPEKRFQLWTFNDYRQELAGHYPGSIHPARIRFEKTQQINLQCYVSLGHNRYPKI
jgi:hypothetical protein